MVVVVVGGGGGGVIFRPGVASAYFIYYQYINLQK